MLHLPWNRTNHQTVISVWQASSFKYQPQGKQLSLYIDIYIYRLSCICTVQSADVKWKRRWWQRSSMHLWCLTNELYLFSPRESVDCEIHFSPSVVTSTWRHWGFWTCAKQLLLRLISVSADAALSTWANPLSRSPQTAARLRMPSETLLNLGDDATAPLCESHSVTYQFLSHHTTI